jgi:Na+/proline symporter
MLHLIELSTVDWIVLGSYLVLVVVIGAIASRRVKDTDHYFLGSRSFGKLVMIAQSFGTGTHAEMPVSLAGAVYTRGLSAIWYQWKNLFVTPFYWILAPLFRRFRRTTMGEVVEDRYGAWMGAFYTAFAVIFFTINLGGMLKGAGKVIAQTTGGHVSVNAIVIGMTCIFVVYSFIGGLVATAWTDVLQGFLILTLSFLVIPLGWHTIGGFAGIRSTLGPDSLSLVTPGTIGIGFILVLTLNGFVGIIAQPHLIASVGTGKTEYNCRIGQVYGNMVKRVCTVGWAFVGLMTAVIVAKGTVGVTQLSDPEEAFGFACRHLLFPGGVGLLVACFLAANMAGCSAFMVDSGALVTNGFYRKYIAPRRSDQHYLWFGRISGVLVTVGAVAYSVLLIQGVLYTFLLTETMSTYVGISILAGVIWRRANRWGAIVSIIVAMGVNFICYAATGRRLDTWDPTVFSISLAAGILALVVVSLLTKPEPATALDTFYHNLDTPSEAEHAKMTALEVAQAGQQLLLVNLLHLRRGACGVGFFRAYRSDLKGLFVGGLFVAGLIAAVWLLVRSG